MTTDSVNCHSQKWLVSTYLTLDAIPKMGIVTLNKTAHFSKCQILDIPLLSDEQLLACAWKPEQVKALRLPSKLVHKNIAKALQWLACDEQHYFVAISDTHYPPLLKQLSRPPLFLFIAGNLECSVSPQLAMIGTRSPSQYANVVIDNLVSSIGQSMDVCITSGMALGVDGLSHRASLHHNIPTIAVLGCGVDIAYPKRHQQLYHDIKQCGAIISEFTPGTPPHASLFPRRNRIISGLSLGVIVIEAKIKSGTLVTARYALEQNKEVFAVPSAIYNPNAEGCHYLIKSGAKLIENAQDILDELPFLSKTPQNVDKQQKSSNQALASDPLLDSVSYSAVSVDLIAKRTGMPVSDVLIQLLQYELRGIVASTPEGYVKLRG